MNLRSTSLIQERSVRKNSIFGLRGVMDRGRHRRTGKNKRQRPWALI